MLKRLTYTSILLVGFSVWVTAQTGTVYYVRAGATGANNGSDWTNAFSALPANLHRSATYFIADGSYSGRTFSTAVSGTSTITIKKATVADHGTSTGWVDSYGDGQATFGGQLNFTTGYFTVDGNTALGTYGIAVRGAGSGANIRIGISTDPSVDNITLRNATVNCGGVATVRGIHLHRSNASTFSNVEVWNCDNDTVSMEACTNCTLEHMSVHTRNNAGVGTHGDAFEIWGGGNNTIRYSRVAYDGQQVFYGGNFVHGRWDIYGNVFYGAPNSGKGITSHSTDPSIGPIYVYNNTFTNLGTASLALRSNTRGDVRNNIFHHTVSPSWGGTTHDYNWFETGLSAGGELHAKSGTTPFVDILKHDYRLRTLVGPGFALAAPYNVDPLGNTRGADNIWDIGAFECVSCGSLTTVQVPTAPRDVRIIR